MSAALYCLGSALVDYEFLVTEKQLKELKLAKGLMTLIDLKQYRYYYEHLRSIAAPARAGGGSAVNSLVTFARLGGQGTLCSTVGDDEDGSFFLNEIHSMGIESLCPLSKAQPTGCCLALITPDSERTMLTHLGANTQLCSTFPPALRPGDFFYAEGYLLAIEQARRTLMEHLNTARQQGLKTALSLSDLSMTSHFRLEFQELLTGGVDFLFGNRDEYYDYTGASDVEGVYASLDKQVGTLIMTAGAEGSWICQGICQGICQAGRIRHIPTPPTQVRDTLGAGDTYAGAYLYAVREGIDDKEAAIFASAAAAQVVSRIGPRLSKQECQSLRQQLLLPAGKEDVLVESC